MLKLLLQKPRGQKTTTHAITFQALQCRHAGVAQLVEHYLAKVDVASSNLVSRSNSGLILSDGAFSFGIVRPRVSRIAGRLCHKVAAVLRGLNSSVTAATLRGV